MNKFTYKDKLKLKELLVDHGFEVDADTDNHNLVAKYIWNGMHEMHLATENEFLSKFYAVLSKHPNVAAVGKYSIYLDSNVVSISSEKFPEEKFLDKSKGCGFLFGENYGGRLAFNVCKINSFYSVVNSYFSIFNKDIAGTIIIDDGQILFITEFDYPHK